MPAEMPKNMQETMGNIESAEERHVEDSNHHQATETSKASVTEEKVVQKHLKRKRESFNESQEEECKRELDELFEYYKEFSGLTLQISDDSCPSHDSLVATLLEESSLSLPKLAEDIITKLNREDVFTLSYVRNIVIRVGQRVKYGIPNEHADVLEDESHSPLWCWEARDVKLLPAAFHESVIIRRMARKKIHERISALVSTLSAISSFKEKSISKSDLFKASNKLLKVLNKQGISLLIDKLKQSDSAGMAEKGGKSKEKLQIDKELKRLKYEAEKEQKRRQKEEAEQKKKQQEESVKEQRRREKEEAELKDRRERQKQVSFMERFFIKSKKTNNVSGECDKRTLMEDLSSETVSKNEETNSATTSSMDHAFSHQHDQMLEEIHKLHVVHWRKSVERNRSSHWGIRRFPKALLINELKLQRPCMDVEPFRKIVTPERESSSRTMKDGNESSFHKLVRKAEEYFGNDTTCQSDLICSSVSINVVHKKLLQFAKSNRPAYYGTFRKRSDVIGPRHPFRKDSQIDYDFDSDEEWEEEDPGESLSDLEKDNDESLGEESSKNEDGDESEDGFVVPDGYLSDNEGVRTEASSSDYIEDEVKHSLCCKSDDGNQKCELLLQQQKFLQELTKNALGKSRPFVIINLNHEKSGLLMTEDLCGGDKHEQICLQALCMRPCLGASSIDISTEHEQLYEARDCSQVSQESSTKAVNADKTTISDSDLPEFVRLIQSCPYGINKVVEVVQQKFPAFSKSQLRKKIQQTSEFVDNHWQVKKEILVNLEMSVSPEEVGKGITASFSKGYLSSPEGLPNVSESSSPEQMPESKH